MSEKLSEAQDTAEVGQAEEALRLAIGSIRNAVGILDTSGPTRKYAGEVENLADRLETKRKPLVKKILQWREQARSEASGPV